MPNIAEEDLMHTIFEDDYYIVRTLDGTDVSSVIIVSFTGVGAPERHDGTCFGYPVGLRLKLPWVGIIAKHDNWYRDGLYSVAFGVASRWVEERKATLTSELVDIVGYGVSMGAYAVVKYSRFFTFDYVFSMAPQWSLDKDEAPHFSHFKQFYTPLLSGMGIRRDDVSGRILVFYDPYEKPDAEEAALITRETGAETVPVCRAGHMVVARLKGSDLFKELLVLRREPAELRRYIARVRRLNIDHLINLFRKSHDRYPKLTYWGIMFLASKNLSVRHELYQRERVLVGSLASSLYRNGEKEMARLLFREKNGTFIAPHLTYYVLSWIGEILCFDPAKRVFSQTLGHVPVSGMPMVVHEDRLFVHAPKGLIPVEVNIFQGQDGLAIRIEQGFLSARPDGSVGFVDGARAWEKYCEYSPL